MSQEAHVDIRLSEIAPGIHQLTTYLPEMDFSLNQFAFKGAVFIAHPHLQFIAGFLVHRNEPRPMSLHQAVNSQHPF